MLSVKIEKRLGNFLLKTDFETEEPITGLLGASGCGKSLTLKCIAGLEQPDQGRILLDSVVLFDSDAGICLPPQKRQVGYLFQSCALFPHMTVKQNILCGMQKEKDRSRRQESLCRLSRLLRLESVMDLKPGSLSGGQAQRTAIARILASRPRLLLLDEPFAALDSYLREQLQAELKELLLSLECQTVLVTHSRDEAFLLCSRLAVMDRGTISAAGGVKELFDHPKTVAAARLTGCKNIAAARKTGDFTVEVPGWGICLTASSLVPDGLRAVGVRAHSFNPDIAVNRFPAALCSRMEEPFEQLFLFRFQGQSPDSPPLWWRLPKEQAPDFFPAALGVSPEQVLLLT